MMVRNRRKTRHEQMRDRSKVYHLRHKILSRLREVPPKGIENILKEIRFTETDQTEFVPGYAGALKWRLKPVEL